MTFPGMSKLAATAGQLIRSVRNIAKVRVRPDPTFLQEGIAPAALKPPFTRFLRGLIAGSPMAAHLPGVPDAVTDLYPQLNSIFPRGGIFIGKGGLAPFMKRTLPALHKQVMSMKARDRASVWKGLNALVLRHEADELLEATADPLRKRFFQHMSPMVLLKEEYELANLSGLSPRAKRAIMNIWGTLRRSTTEASALEAATGRPYLSNPPVPTRALSDAILAKATRPAYLKNLRLRQYMSEGLGMKAARQRYAEEVARLKGLGVSDDMLRQIGFY